MVMKISAIWLHGVISQKMVLFNLEVEHEVQCFRVLKDLPLSIKSRELRWNLKDMQTCIAVKCTQELTYVILISHVAHWWNDYTMAVEFHLKLLILKLWMKFWSLIYVCKISLLIRLWTSSHKNTEKLENTCELVFEISCVPQNRHDLFCYCCTCNQEVQ